MKAQDARPARVVKSETGRWDVVDDSGEVLASFETNAQAWRFVDLHTEGEPLSRREHVVNWINKKWP